MRIRNTEKGGIAEAFIYKKGNHYIGVCLTFDIIREGNDPKILAIDLEEAIRGYVENVIKNNLSDELLNRSAPKEYWNKYHRYLEILLKKGEIKSLPEEFENAHNFTVPLLLYP